MRWLLVGGLILLVGGQPRFLFVTTALVLGIAVFVLSPPAIFQDRSFFGVTAVLRPPGSPFTVLMNGTTVHGIQSTDPALAGSRAPTTRRMAHSATPSGSSAAARPQVRAPRPARDDRSGWSG